MTFYSFMIKKYSGKDDPRGDLARDMYKDGDRFPKNMSCSDDGARSAIRGYLLRRGACPECMDTFADCLEAYVRCERKQLSRV